MAFSLPHAELRVLVDLKRRLVDIVAGVDDIDGVRRGLRAFGQALEGLARHDRHAALVLVVTTAEELRQAIGAGDEHTALLESTLSAFEASLQDALGQIETALVTLIELRTRRSWPSARVRTILDIIARRYAEPLTLDALARCVCRERAYVASQFRRETGCTIHRYLISVRMQHAAELLESGEKVEAVMLLVGYHSKKSFYSQFRVHSGQTPGSVRRRPQTYPAKKPTRPLTLRQSSAGPPLGAIFSPSLVSTSSHKLRRVRGPAADTRTEGHS